MVRPFRAVDAVARLIAWRVAQGFRPCSAETGAYCTARGNLPEAAIGKYQGKQTGENSLLRTLYDVLGEGDVVLADRYFSGWCDIARECCRSARRRRRKS